VPSTLAHPYGLQQRAKATHQEEGAADIPDLICEVKRVGCDRVFFAIQLADKPLIEILSFSTLASPSVNTVKDAVKAALLLA
jgi:hypothetical protein